MTLRDCQVEGLCALQHILIFRGWETIFCAYIEWNQLEHSKYDYLYSGITL